MTVDSHTTQSQNNRSSAKLSIPNTMTIVVNALKFYMLKLNL